VSPPPRQPSNLPASVHARLGNARIPFQVDVGFGDIVVDPPARRELPTLLDLPAPELSVYPVEAVVAEKIEAMVRFDALNTRLKDYFDLYVLATEVTIDDASLTRQLAQTFQRRGTPLPVDEPAGLSDAFATDSERNARWRAFLERSGGAASAPASFPEVVDRIRDLVLVPLEAARSGA